MKRCICLVCGRSCTLNGNATSWQKNYSRCQFSLSIIFLINWDHLLPHISLGFIELSVSFAMLLQSKCMNTSHLNISYFIVLVVSMIFQIVEYHYPTIFHNIFSMTVHFNISDINTIFQSERIKINRPTCAPTTWGLLSSRVNCLLWSKGPQLP